MTSPERRSSGSTDSNTEKLDVLHTEYSQGGALNPEDAAFLAGFTDKRRKKVLRKVDWRLVPMLLLLYLLSFIDRANIGNAKIEGMTEDLRLSGLQFNVALALFFVPYTLCEVPSNIILNTFNRPSTFMGIIIFLWSLMVLVTGFVQNFAGLVACRILLGIFEAGFFPGAILIVSRWYLPFESQTRIAIFFTASAMAGAFSGLLAYAIAKMDGLAGYSGWRWIFIIEGAASCAIGISCFWLLIDSPTLSHKWLEPDEIRYLELRQLARRMNKPKEYREKSFDMKIFVRVLTDWKIYLLVLAFWSNVTPNYGLKFTMPTIIQNMGYESSNAQLLTIPCYTVGALSAYAFAVVSDRFRWRMPFIVGPQFAVVIAQAILFGKAENIQDNIAVCYFAVCLACFGLYPIGSGVQAWNLNNHASPSKLAMAIGYLTCIGNMGGITGSFIFIEDEAPEYPTGFGSSLAFASAGIFACLALEFIMWRINKKRDQTPEAEIRAKHTDDELEEMGDKSPLYRYTL